MAVVEKPEEKLTRSKVLKRVGIGAAAVWSVPLLVTNTASAATDVSGKLCARLAADRGVGACTPCPGCNNQCRGSGNCQVGDCYCGTKLNGCCSCTVNDSCSNLRPCARQSDCPAGFECQYTCCAEPRTRCTRKCPAGGAIDVAPGSGPTSGGG